MNRKLNLLILMLAASLLLNGCWDSQELNSLSIVSATSIDRSEDEWVISFQVVIPQSIATQTGGGAGEANLRSPSSPPGARPFAKRCRTRI